MEGDLQIIFEIHRRQKGSRLVDFGLVIPLPVPAVGLGFTLEKIKFMNVGEDPTSWTPCSVVSE
jgi:hypothetical protein